MLVRSSTRRRARAGAGPSNWMLAPALVFFGIFAIGPLLGVLVLSFMERDGLGTPQWTGGENWVSVLENPVSRQAMVPTVQLTLLSYAVQFPLSLLLGVFMAGRQRYPEFLSVLYFLPMLFSAAAIGIAFKALLDPNFGLSRAFDAALLRQDWLGDGSLAFHVVVVVISWSFIPFHSLLHQAGSGRSRGPCTRPPPSTARARCGSSSRSRCRS